MANTRYTIIYRQLDGKKFVYEVNEYQIVDNGQTYEFVDESDYSKRRREQYPNEPVKSERVPVGLCKVEVNPNGGSK